MIGPASIGDISYTVTPRTGSPFSEQVNEQWFVGNILANLDKLRAEGESGCTELGSLAQVCHDLYVQQTAPRPGMRWDAALARLVLAVAEGRKRAAEQSGRTGTPYASLDPVREAARLDAIKRELDAHTWGPNALALMATMALRKGTPDQFVVRANIPWGWEIPLTPRPVAPLRP